MAARALKAVPDKTEPPLGDHTLTQEAMASWSRGQRKCRTRKRHHWMPFTVWERRTTYEVIERCADCRNRRSADFNKQGHRLTDWKTVYRDGYLLPTGAARLDEDANDELMLTEILSRRIVEALDDADEED